MTGRPSEYSKAVDSGERYTDGFNSDTDRLIRRVADDDVMCFHSETEFFADGTFK